MDDKLKTMVGLAVKWNRKELSGDNFAASFWTQYEKECLEAWKGTFEDTQSGEVYRLSDLFLNRLRPGKLLEKARERRFRFIKLDEDKGTIKVIRISDEGKGKRESYYQGYLTKIDKLG